MLGIIYRRVDKKVFYSLLSVFAVLLVSEVWLTALIPDWKAHFFDMLKDKNASGFQVGLLHFTGLVFSLGFVIGVKQFASQMLSLSLRKATAKVLLKAWTGAPEIVTTNYIQAQTESIRVATDNVVYVFREVVVSAGIVVILILNNLDQPKVLVISLIYTIVISLSALLFNRPLMRTNAAWQAAEGSYLESLGQIAHGKGDHTAKDKFIIACSKLIRFTATQMSYTLFGALKGSAMLLIPFAIFASDYFSGAITFGAFMGIVTTFDLLVINATIFAMMYPQWTNVKSSYGIIKEFYGKLTPTP